MGHIFVLGVDMDTYAKNYDSHFTISTRTCRVVPYHGTLIAQAWSRQAITRPEAR